MMPMEANVATTSKKSHVFLTADQESQPQNFYSFTN